MAGPIKRIVAKHKTTGRYLNLFACWPSKYKEGALNLTLDGDGSEFREYAKNPDAYYVNIYDNTRGGDDSKRSPRAAQPRRRQNTEDLSDNGFEDDLDPFSE